MSTFAATALVVGGVFFSAVPAAAVTVQPSAVPVVLAAGGEADPQYLLDQYHYWSRMADKYKKEGKTTEARKARARADEAKRRYDRLTACDRNLHC
ncbi:hypothetical protein ACFV7Q_20240 [Streptomyces sp. NPDC059851]|uniref:hypothetical protein n=1 Tax=Streptomyces sp. NPDC059851 TaxID=3346971 RepID=UPI00365A5EFD